MGFKPRDIPLAFEKTDVPTTEMRIKGLKEARDEALAAHELARELMAQRSLRKFTPFG
jgi:hypothetical protein